MGNTAYPMYYTEDGGETFDPNVKISETYLGEQFRFMRISLEERNELVQKLNDAGKEFSNNWYCEASLNVDSANPLYLKYKENGEQKIQQVKNGRTSIVYKTTDASENSIISGYLEYRYNGTGTAGFTCGISFLYKGSVPAPTSPRIVYNDPSAYAVLCGIDGSMEYQYEGDTEWTTCTANRIALTSTTKPLYVRYCAIEDTEVSLSKVLNIKQQGAFPSVTLDRYTGKITGLTKDMEMSDNRGAWEPISDEVLENGAVETSEEIIDVERAPHLHNYVKANYKSHKKNTDGSCTETVYAAYRCTLCSAVVIGDEISTTTYKKCPH